jgi:ribonuclease HII
VKNNNIPSLRFEKNLIRRYGGLCAGVDEVGRGPGAGPCAVGIVVASPNTKPLSGLRDSKQLSARARDILSNQIYEWAEASAVGFATNVEIDELGINSALSLAGLRAFEQISNFKGSIILDGNFDWISPIHLDEWLDYPLVFLKIKADQSSSTVAAASIIAKVARDKAMRDQSVIYPEYKWEENKGYLTKKHISAIKEFGLSPLHRKSWQIDY